MALLDETKLNIPTEPGARQRFASISGRPHAHAILPVAPGYTS